MILQQLFIILFYIVIVIGWGFLTILFMTFLFTIGKIWKERNPNRMDFFEMMENFWEKTIKKLFKW